MSTEQITHEFESNLTFQNCTWVEIWNWHFTWHSYFILELFYYRVKYTCENFILKPSSVVEEFCYYRFPLLSDKLIIFFPSSELHLECISCASSFLCELISLQLPYWFMDMLVLHIRFSIITYCKSCPPFYIQRDSESAIPIQWAEVTSGYML